jgi:signal transduction histidine kinase
MKQDQTPLFLPEEAVLEQVFAHTTEGIVWIGPDYSVKAYNPSFARQISPAVGSLSGASIEQIFPAWGTQLITICSEVKKSNKPFFHEIMKVVPVLDRDRAFFGWLLLFKEMTYEEPILPLEQRMTEKVRSNLEGSDLLQKAQIQQDLSAAVLNSSPVGIAVFDGYSLKLNWLNRVFHHMLGKNPEKAKLVGLPLCQLIPGAQRNGLFAACHYVVATGKPFIASEFWIDGCQPGGAYWRLTIVPLETAEGEPPMLLFIVVDLTEQIKNRKKQEELVRFAENSLAQLEAVMNNLTEGIVVINPQHQVVYINPAGQKIFGFHTDEALRPLADYYQRFCFQDLSATPILPEAYPLHRPLQGSSFINLELGVEDLVQERFWIGSFSGTPVRNPQGDLIFGLVVVRDITQAKKAEQERERLLASEQKARTEAERQALQKQVLLDNIGEGVLVIAPDGRLLLANKVAMELFEDNGQAKTIEEFFGRHTLVREDGSPLPPAQLLTPRLLAGDYFTNEEYRIRGSDGKERRILISGNEVKDRQGQIFMLLVTLRDVSELRRLEQLKEDYLHMVSHDLRSPLAVLLSHAQLLAMIAKDDARIGKSAQAIATSSLQMKNMIADLVDSTRIESGQLVLKTSCFDLVSFLYDFLFRMRGVMEVDRIRIVKKQPLPPIIADPCRLERIFVNFLSNALKYSPAGTMVEIIPRINGDRMVVAIRDQGPGIDPGDLPYIFDRYYRVRTSKEEGLGLGLYIIKNLVEAHGGTVWVESKPGEGSTFFFTLTTFADREGEEPKSRKEG